MKPYPRYKDSEIKWIDTIPEFWKEFPICRLGSLMNGLNKPKEAYGSGFRFVTVKNLYINNIIDQQTLDRVEVYEEELKRFKLMEHDILMARSSVDPKGVGYPAIIGKPIEDTVFSGFIIRFRGNSYFIKKEFMLWLFLSSAVRGIVTASANTVAQSNLSQTALKQIQVPIPSLTEQHQIATYLDHKTHQIDTLIAKKQRLIELLKEERTAVINEAVTKGIDPDAPMKDSGIEWLGEIPAHWDVKKIKYEVFLKSGDSITSESISSEGEYPVYGGNGLRGYANTYSHEGDYVLIGRQGALCGNINYAVEKFFASEHAVVATPINKCKTLWFGELLRSMNLNQYSQSAAQPGLSVDVIKNLFIPVPDIEEQQLISQYIEKETTRIDTLITKTKKEIDLLQEFRTALISEVVTGKIDVRDWEQPQNDG